MGTRIQQTDLARDALYTKVNQIADEKQDVLTSGVGVDITSNTVSVEGVKDQNNTSTAIKTWTGTRAQYNAIATKDANTLYNITDDVNLTTTILEALYPVGAIYIGTQSTCPLITLIPGSTWTLVATDRVLQGSGNNSAGSTIAAGLPNISGTFGFGNIAGVSYPYAVTNASGSFVASGTTPVANVGTNSVQGYGSLVDLNASRSSAIYGNSNTVQPPAYVVNIWERTV